MGILDARDRHRFPTFMNEFYIENDDISSRQEPGSHGDQQGVSITLTPGQTLPGTGFRTLCLRELASVDDVLSPPILASSEKQYLLESLASSGLSLPDVTLASRDITRWRMAWRAEQTFIGGNDKKNFFKFKVTPDVKGLLVPRCEESPTLETLWNTATATSMSAATFLYGGLHALAWSAHFETSTERLLWRISSCAVMAGLPLSSFLFWALHIIESDRVQQYKYPFVDLINTVLVFLQILQIPIFLLYVLARAYLVVECFISLSHLPAGVYDVPSWSVYFPHIS